MKKSKKYSVEPVSSFFGFDRGKPIDRYYIEKFLKKHQASIQGNVLEVGDNHYTKKYGTGVIKSDVLDIQQTNYSTIVGNLETGENIPLAAYDCIILTQVIQFIYDTKSVLRNTLKALKPGGVLLLTTAGLSQYCRSSTYEDYWRFTDKSLYRLFLDLESLIEKTKIQSYGNVAVAKAFLDGYALHEIPKKILKYKDNNYQIILTAYIQKR